MFGPPTKKTKYTQNECCKNEPGAATKAVYVLVSPARRSDGLGLDENSFSVDIELRHPTHHNVVAFDKPESDPFYTGNGDYSDTELNSDDEESNRYNDEFAKMGNLYRILSTFEEGLKELREDQAETDRLLDKAEKLLNDDDSDDDDSADEL